MISRSRAIFVLFINLRFSTILKSNISAENVKLGVEKQKSLRLKKHFSEFYRIVRKSKSNAPIILFSAGVGNVIVEKLKQDGFDLNDMVIISNFFDYESKRLLNESSNITMFTKNSDYIPKDNLSANVKLFIVIGDHDQDFTMMKSKSLPNETSQKIFSIGLINQKDFNDKTLLKAKIETFTQNFDAFVVNDEDFGVFTKICKNLEPAYS